MPVIYALMIVFSLDVMIMTGILIMDYYGILG